MNRFKWKFAAAASVCAAALLVAQTPTQAPRARYMTITQTRVDAANAAEYEKLMTEQYAKVAKVRTEGDVATWSFSKVLMPTGQTQDFTHLQVVVWKKEPILNPDGSAIEKTFEKAGVDRAAYRKKRDALGSKLVRTEIWRHLDGTGPLEPGDLTRLDYKLVKQGAAREYVEAERTLYKPTHEQRIKHGALKQWNLASIFLPGGSDYPYSHATLEVYKDEAQMFTPPRLPDTPWKLAHGDKDFAPTADKMAANVKQLHRTVLKVLAVVSAPAN